MDNLKDLKYTELRNLAKRLGLKTKGKTNKLRRDIRKYFEEDGTTEENHTDSVGPTLNSSADDEITFSFNPLPGIEGPEESTESSMDDEIVLSFSPVSGVKGTEELTGPSMEDKIAILAANPTEEDNAKDECNKSTELESIEDKLCDIEDQNETVEFEEHQVTESEMVDNEEVEEQLNTTFEIETNRDEKGGNGATSVEKEEKEDNDEEEEEQTKEKEKNVQDLLEVMRPEMTDEEMKAELMAAIDKKIKTKKVTIMSPNAASKFVSHIPTLSTANKSQADHEKVTLKGKDWQKIHEKLFNKQDSLDVYLAKKNKRMKMMNTPVKSAKRIAAESQKMVEKFKNRKETQSATKCSTKKTSTQSFIPTIISTKSMSLQFSTTTSTVHSVTKSSRTPVASITPSQKNKMVKSAKKSHIKSLSNSAKKWSPKIAAAKTPAKAPLAKNPFTPFNFGNNSLVRTPDSTKKAKFDLQASLAKPMTWKCHKGKLRPVAFGDVEPQYFKKGLNTSIQTNRENRRTIAVKSRATKRDNLLNRRRNIK